MKRVKNKKKERYSKLLYWIHRLFMIVFFLFLLIIFLHHFGFISIREHGLFGKCKYEQNNRQHEGDRVHNKCIGSNIVILVEDIIKTVGSGVEVVKNTVVMGEKMWKTFDNLFKPNNLL